MTMLQSSGPVVLGAVLVLAIGLLMLCLWIDEVVYRTSQRVSLWWLLGGPERLACRIGVALLWLPCLIEASVWRSVDALGAAWLRTHQLTTTLAGSARAWTAVVRVR